MVSKRALKKYLGTLKKRQLEEQVLDLYGRFPVVKVYYDFVFNPKEDQLIGEAKSKITNEYFPVKRKKPRARRSVAQKYIKQFLLLGMDPALIADLMLFNLETAQSFAARRNLPDSFFKSMLNSFDECIRYISVNNLLPDFKERILVVYQVVTREKWLYLEGFSRALDAID